MKYRSKVTLKTFPDVSNKIPEELFFYQKVYGKTTRLKILNTIKKKDPVKFYGTLVFVRKQKLLQKV